MSQTPYIMPMLVDSASLLSGSVLGVVFALALVLVVSVWRSL